MKLTPSRAHATAVPEAFSRFWNGKYSLDQLEELDDLEGRGAERFLTWFAFDYPLDDGRTLAEHLAAPGANADEAGHTALDLSEEEARLLGGWANVRLQPYVVEGVRKGQGMRVTNLVEGTQFEVEDHAASRRVELGEVLVAHLLPAGDYYYIGGAAAHLTEDTREKMREFLGLHLEAFQRDHVGATWADLVRAQSDVLNHFVMQLPVEESNPSLLDNIVVQTRISLKLAGESLGIGKRDQNG